MASLMKPERATFHLCLQALPSSASAQHVPASISRNHALLDPASNSNQMSLSSLQIVTLSQACPISRTSRCQVLENVIFLCGIAPPTSLASASAEMLQVALFCTFPHFPGKIRQLHVLTLLFLQRLGAYLALSDEQDLPLKSLAIQVHYHLTFQCPLSNPGSVSLGHRLLERGCSTLVAKLPLPSSPLFFSTPPPCFRQASTLIFNRHVVVSCHRAPCSPKIRKSATICSCFTATFANLSVPSLIKSPPLPPSTPHPQSIQLPSSHIPLHVSCCLFFSLASKPV
jgi:hypothetical protein